MSGLYVLAIVTAAILFVFGLWQSAKRGKELAAWAASKGLTFSTAKDRALDERFPAFRCLHRGRSRYADNIAEGNWNGRHVSTFDYRYVTGAGKSRRTHRFSAIVLQSSAPLKPLHLRPEGFFDRVTEFFGLDDIDFESAEFSRAFHVKSKDKRWAYDALHPRTIEFLLSMPRFSIQFNDNYVIVWKNQRFNSETFEDAISVAEGILDRLPEYLVRQQSQRRGDT
jgi:hypothetical protein